MPASIELRNVSKSFGSKEVLRRANLTVDKGETKILLGGSGQGKSTILKLLLGLEKPDEGNILIESQDITPLSEEEMISVRKKIGMVFQESSLFDSITVFDNISYRLVEDAKLSPDEIMKTTERYLHLVDLEEDDLTKLPEQLSGGMKRRVAIARALGGDHNIMLYDEPTAGLDPITAAHITNLIIRLRDLEKVTSLIVTQDLFSSFTMMTHCAHKGEKGIEVKVNPGHTCSANTKIIILKDGRIIADGTLNDLLKSQDSYVQEFLTPVKLLVTR